MTEDILTNSLAESIRYLRAYGEERLREVESAWNSLDDDELPEAPKLNAEPTEIPNSAIPLEEPKGLPTMAEPDIDQPSRSLLQRLLGW